MAFIWATYGNIWASFLLQYLVTVSVGLFYCSKENPAKGKAKCIELNFVLISSSCSLTKQLSTRIFFVSNHISRAVVVTQLTQWLLQTRQVCSSNPVIVKFLKTKIKRMGQTRPLFHLFLSFQTFITIFTTKNMKKCRSSIQCRDSNSQPLEHQSPPITTRPGLPPILNILLFSIFSIGQCSTLRSLLF